MINPEAVYVYIFAVVKKHVISIAILWKMLEYRPSQVIEIQSIIEALYNDGDDYVYYEREWSIVMRQSTKAIILYAYISILLRSSISIRHYVHTE